MSSKDNPWENWHPEFVNSVESQSKLCIEQVHSAEVKDKAFEQAGDCWKRVEPGQVSRGLDQGRLCI